MKHFTVSLISDDELIATYDDGEHRLMLKQKLTDDFAFDCACAIDTIAVNLSKIDKKEGQ